MTEKKSRAGGFFLMGIGLAVALTGAVFVWLLWSSYSQVRETKHWTETPCVISVSDYNTRSAEHISMEYSWKLKYDYTVDGKEYSSKFHTTRPAKWTSGKDRITAIIDAHPVGMETVCYVNPAVPSQAILSFESQATLYSIWFPMLFVVGGIGIMLGALRGMKIIPC